MAKKILIIEDDESNLRILKMTTSLFKCEVLTANNGEQGLEMARVSRPDLILMDVMMPKMSGLDTLREIRGSQSLSSIPVIVISAGAAVKDAKEAMAAGANEFITKPFHVKDIQNAIRKYLEN